MSGVRDGGEESGYIGDACEDGPVLYFVLANTRNSVCDKIA